MTDITKLDPGAWRQPQRRVYADPVITRQCGDRDVQRKSATAVASSPVLGYWPPGYSRQFIGQEPPPAHAQLTVAVYPDDTVAAAAVLAPHVSEFGDCIFSAIERYDRSRGVDPAENEFRSSDGRKPRSDIETNSAKSDASGEPVRILQAGFSDEILGGTDNSHDIVETIGRAGRVVVTLCYVTNSQQGDAARTRADAQRLTGQALKRVKVVSS